MTNFDADTLNQLRELQEVHIRTEKHPESAIVIWLAVVDNDIFVRSWLGAKGRWYKDLAAGGPATLEFAGRRLAVRAVPANDLDSVTGTSREILRKYQRSSHAQGMVREDIAPSTMRLEPR
jgi:hypothetical protein